MGTSQAWDIEDLWMGRMVLLFGMAEWLCISSIKHTLHPAPQNRGSFDSSQSAVEALSLSSGEDQQHVLGSGSLVPALLSK